MPLSPSIYTAVHVRRAGRHVHRRRHGSISVLFYFCALGQGHGITWWRPSGVTDTRRVSEAVGSDTVAWIHGPSSPVRWWRDSPTFKCADASLWIHLEINARGNKDPRPGSSAAARSRIITSSSRGVRGPGQHNPVPSANLARGSPSRGNASTKQNRLENVHWTHIHSSWIASRSHRFKRWLGPVEARSWCYEQPISNPSHRNRCLSNSDSKFRRSSANYFKLFLGFWCNISTKRHMPTNPIYLRHCNTTANPSSQVTCKPRRTSAPSSTYRNTRQVRSKRARATVEDRAAIPFT